jgi:hypothetical protein
MMLHKFAAPLPGKFNRSVRFIEGAVYHSFQILHSFKTQDFFISFEIIGYKKRKPRGYMNTGASRMFPKPKSVGSRTGKGKNYPALLQVSIIAIPAQAPFGRRGVATGDLGGLKQCVRVMSRQEFYQ